MWNLDILVYVIFSKSRPAVQIDDDAVGTSIATAYRKGMCGREAR